MKKTLIKKTCSVIFSNEGNYGSVNRNDNGAVSVGRLQWHGGRAKGLLRNIIRYNEDNAKKCLTVRFYNEILIESGSWDKRTVDDIEAQQIKLLLCSTAGLVIQDRTAENDVEDYLCNIMEYDITDENTLVFLADIHNQGGYGAVKRIIENTFSKYGKYATLEEFVDITIKDKVFKNYKQRRYDVYRKLTGKSYTGAGSKYLTYHVKRGDNLTKIAYKYGTTVQRLVKDNGIDDPNKIYVDQQIKIYK